MYLTSLELVGFKSFAKKTLLEFSSPITAIVGPNGSGKSNIAEAFRFVLGEQSMKAMRGRRVEDLIWNGGADMPRANRAAVRLTFDNRSRFLDIDFEGVSVERIIYRDASSEYRINGAQVRLRDVVELLAPAHIGASGHHIISQGEADKILSANPVERREMLSDALGLKVYQWKREESERKLTKTEENIAQVESLRREISPHLTFLKRQVEKIEKARVLKEGLRERYLEYLKRESVYLSVHKKKLEAERTAPKDELATLEQSLEKARMLRDRAATTQSPDQTTVLERERAALRKNYDARARELGRIEGEIKIIERVSGAEKSHIASVPFAEVKALGAHIEEYIREAGREESPSALREIFGKIGTLFSSFLERYRERRGDDFSEQLATLGGRREALSRELLGVETAEETTAEKLEKLRHEAEERKESHRAAERAVFEMMAKRGEVEQRLHDLDTRARELTHAEEDFNRECEEGTALIGREILTFDDFPITDAAGRPISPHDIAREDRPLQEERRRALERLKIRVEDRGVAGAQEVIREYQEVSERETFLSRELQDLERGAATLRDIIKELSERLDVEFREGMHKVNEVFQQFFTVIFGGGRAALVEMKVVHKRHGSAEDDEERSGLDEFPSEKLEEEGGVEIEVSLPGKKIKGLATLSGGERALTSMALIFAMSQVNPPPFLVLDETDAALDESNSKKCGDMIENLAQRSQLILITHNRETMSRAGILYGVTMDRSGTSKLLSIKFEEALKVAK